MRWSMKIVSQRIKLNKKQNIFLIIQIILSAAILFSCLSVEESCNKKTAEYEKEVSSQIITINANRTQEDKGIEIKDYEYVKDNLLPENYTAVYSVSTSIYIEYNGKTEWRIPVIFVSEEYMTAIVGLTIPDSNGYYLGEKIAEAIYSNKFIISYGDCFYDKSTGALFGWPIKEYAILDVASTAQLARNTYLTSYTGDDLTFSNSLFLPIDVYEQYKDDIGNVDGSLFIIPKQENDPFVDKICDNICKELARRHPSIWFTYSNDLANLLKYQTELLRNAVLFKTISIIMIIVLLFELIGQFMLLIFKRQRSLAIAKMCGAEIWKLIIELVIEIDIISSAGAL